MKNLREIFNSANYPSEYKIDNVSYNNLLDNCKNDSKVFLYFENDYLHKAEIELFLRNHPNYDSLPNHTIKLVYVINIPNQSNAIAMILDTISHALAAKLA